MAHDLVASGVLPAATMPENYDVIVIGAGQAGLAAGYYLSRAGLRFTLLDASARPAGAWPHYYDSLTLFSPAAYSALPGLRFPGEPGHYPRRDEVSAYLRAYAHHFRLPVLSGAHVSSVERIAGLFHITAGDERYTARAVIAATGSFSRPFLPQLPGQRTYGGRIVHAAAYRNPAPFCCLRVVVVGGGNSAVQIAVELAEHARVTLATRRPIRFTPQRVLGRDIFWWLSLARLEQLPFGRVLRLHEPNVVLDTGAYRRAIAAGAPPRRQMFRSFSRDGVVWPGGEHTVADVVLFATGYRPNFDYLRPLGVLDASGTPQQRAGVGRVAGLYFLGLPGQRTWASATMRGAGPDARYIVRHLRAFLQKNPRMHANGR